MKVIRSKVKIVLCVFKYKPEKLQVAQKINAQKYNKIAID